MAEESVTELASQTGSQTTPPATSTPASAAKPGRKPDAIHSFFVKVGEQNTTCKRQDHQCRRCPTIIKAGSAKLDVLKKHIMEGCRGVTPEERRELLQQEAACAVSSGSETVAAATGAGKRRRSSVGDIRALLPPSAAQLKPQHLVSVAEHLLRFLVTSNVSFKAVENPHLHAALDVLRPGYVPPGETTMRTTMLQREYAAVMTDLYTRLSKADHLTLALDCYTNYSVRSLCAFVVILPERSPRLLEVVDISTERHTGEFLAGLIKDTLVKHGIKDKVALIVTDNGPDVRQARRLVVSSDGFKHMMDIRCAFHGFALILGSWLAFPWAKQLVVGAQRIVSYFQQSLMPLGKLREAAKTMGITRGLASSNKTRTTSVHLCLESLHINAPAFTVLVQRDSSIIKNAQVLELLKDHSFWADIENLCKLLEPLSKIIMGVQKNDATLADVLRYLVYLSQTVPTVLDQLPADYQQHIIQAFNHRAKELDHELCRLALFLDPRYRAAACSTSGGDPAGRADMLHKLKAKAGSLAHARGYSSSDLRALLQQMSAYSQGEPPFDLSCSGSGFMVKGWWQAVRSGGSEQLADLALVVYAVLPHAANPEQAFSAMGWFHSGQRANMGVGTEAMLTTISMHYNALKPAKALKESQPLELDDVRFQLSPYISEEVAATLQATAAAAAEQQAGMADDSASPEELDAQLSSMWEREQEAIDTVQPPFGCSTWMDAVREVVGDIDMGLDMMNPAYTEQLQSASRPVQQQGAYDPMEILREMEAEAAASRAAAAAAAAAGGGGQAPMRQPLPAYQQQQPPYQQQQQRVIAAAQQQMLGPHQLLGPTGQQRVDPVAQAMALQQLAQQRLAQQQLAQQQLAQQY